MTSSEQAPRTSARTRLLRPDLFTDDATGTLAPAALLAYLGLSTRADDAGFLLWRPTAIAAAITPYVQPGRRERDLERMAEQLCAAGLLLRFDCDCAELPRMVRDLAVKGGNKSFAIRDWHLAHTRTDASVQVQIDPDESVSGSGSGSSSESFKGSSSGPGPRDGSAPASAAGSGRARSWTEAEWLDELHRIGMPMDRALDATWSPWLASLQRRHDDQELLEAVRAVAASGETRPALVQDLVRVRLEQPVGSHT